MIINTRIRSSMGSDGFAYLSRVGNPTASTAISRRFGGLSSRKGRIGSRFWLITPPGARSSGSCGDNRRRGVGTVIEPIISAIDCRGFWKCMSTGIAKRRSRIIFPVGSGNGCVSGLLRSCSRAGNAGPRCSSDRGLWREPVAVRPGRRADW